MFMVYFKGAHGQENRIKPGKERHAALKRFAQLQKERPGLEYITDIEKKSWER